MEEKKEATYTCNQGNSSFMQLIMSVLLPRLTSVSNNSCGCSTCPFVTEHMMEYYKLKLEHETNKAKEDKAGEGSKEMIN